MRDRSFLSLTSGLLAIVWLTAGVAFAQDGGRKGKRGPGGMNRKMGQGIPQPQRPDQGQKTTRGTGQRPGIFQAPSETYLRLLALADVQKELKFSDDDKANLPLLKAELQESDQKFLSSLSGVAPTETADKWSARWKEIEKNITELLGAERYKRFRQIRWQISGLERSLSDSSVRDSLKLTDEQQAKLREISRPAGGNFGKNRTRPTDPAAATADREEQRKQRAEKVLAVLNDVQKAKWKELIGEPIGFTPERGNRGPGRPERRKSPLPDEKKDAAKKPAD